MRENTPNQEEAVKRTKLVEVMSNPDKMQEIINTHAHVNATINELMGHMAGALKQGYSDAVTISFVADEYLKKMSDHESGPAEGALMLAEAVRRLVKITEIEDEVAKSEPNEQPGMGLEAPTQKVENAATLTPEQDAHIEKVMASTKEILANSLARFEQAGFHKMPEKEAVGRLATFLNSLGGKSDGHMKYTMVLCGWAILEILRNRVAVKNN